MTNPALADPRERRYLSPYSGDGVGLLIHRMGVLADADGDVETSLIDEEGNPAFTAVADKVDTGSYVTLNSPQQTARSGLFTVRWSYALGGVNQSYESYVEIGQPNPSYDNLPEGMKDVIEMCWMRFADLYDSPAGGPHFQTYFQTHYNRGRMADLLRIAMGTLNTVSQPWTTFSATLRAKSPRIVPGAEARGFVAPRRARPCLTTSLPCQTIATTGPEAMYLIRPGKKGLPLRSL